MTTEHRYMVRIPLRTRSGWAAPRFWETKVEPAFAMEISGILVKDELVGKVIFVLVFIPRYAYNAVILCEPIIWCFMTAYLVAVYLHEPFVFPKK